MHFNDRIIVKLLITVAEEWQKVKHVFKSEIE